MAEKPTTLELMGMSLSFMRMAMGFTIRKFAIKSDIDRIHIANIEKGVTDISIPTLEKYCNALGISLMELFNSIAD